MSAGGAASAAAPAPASRIAAWAADPRLPTVLLGAAAVVSAVLLVVLNSKLTFFIDDWEVLLHRRGLSLDVFMEPHAGHPAIGLAALYKAILVTFGMSSLTPYAVASTLVFVLSVVLLYVWMRRRVGAWLALAGALPILFLGAAYEDLLTPFQVGYFAPVACGLAALLALERGRPRDPLLCCVLLVVGLSFQTIGLAFVAGVAVALAFDGQLRRRAWVPIVPVVLYGLWYLGWGHTGGTQFTFENLATAPAFVLDGFSASLASLLGFATPEDGGLEWGRALFAVLVVLAAARLLALGRVPKGVWVALAIGVVFWVMIALNASYFRSAETSRYQFLGAVFVLMFAAEVWSGARPGRTVVGLALLVSLAAVGGNLIAHARRQPRPAQPGAGGPRRPRRARDHRRPRRSGARARPRQLGLRLLHPARRGQLPLRRREVRLARLRRGRARRGARVRPRGRRPGDGGGARAASGSSSRRPRMPPANRSAPRACSCRCAPGTTLLRQAGDVPAPINLAASPPSPRRSSSAGSGPAGRPRSRSRPTVPRGPGSSRRPAGLELC